MISRLTICIFLLALLPSTGMLHAAGDDEQPQERTRIEAELIRLRAELAAEKGRNETRLKALEEEIAILRTRLDAQDSTGEREGGAGESPGDGELDTLLGDLDDEDELDSLLGDLSGGGESDLSGGELHAPASVSRVFQSMNPDISVIGDFLGHYTSQEGEDFDDEFRFAELELGFSASIDTYARADFFLALEQEANGDWEAALEEGYATFLTLPFDIQPRLGRFKSTFGKANPVHPHALPWVEYPLVIQHYFGDAGLAGDGVGINWLVPNPWDNFIELTYELTNNDNDGPLFAGDAADDFMHVVHLKNFMDLTDASTLETGVSFATAPNDGTREGNRSHVGGVDVTFKWRPPESALYEGFLWQTEVMAVDAHFPGDRETSWGMYSAMDYQFARRWSTGVRYDYVTMPIDNDLDEQAGSLFLTFIQSEFLFWRLGYRYTGRNFRDAILDHHKQEVFLQINFGIGPHRAHKY